MIEGKFLYHILLSISGGKCHNNVWNKTTHHFLNVKDRFNKSFKHSIEFNELLCVTYPSPMLGCVVLYIY